MEILTALAKENLTSMLEKCLEISIRYHSLGLAWSCNPDNEETSEIREWSLLELKFLMQFVQMGAHANEIVSNFPGRTSKAVKKAFW